MDGPGAAGRCTKAAGYLAQFEITTDVLANGAVAHLDSNSQTHWVDKVRKLCPKFEGIILTLKL